MSSHGYRGLEFKADKLFEAVGIGPFLNDQAEDHFDQAALVLVVNDPPVGFVSVGEWWAEFRTFGGSPSIPTMVAEVSGVLSWKQRADGHDPSTSIRSR